MAKNTQSRPVPEWISRFPGFAHALELAKQRAREECWPCPADETWVLEGALRAGLDHMLGQPNETRVLARPEPRFSEEDRALTVTEYEAKQRGGRTRQRRAAAHVG